MGWIEENNYKKQSIQTPGLEWLKFKDDCSAFYTFTGDSVLRKWNFKTGINTDARSNLPAFFDIEPNNELITWCIGDSNTNFRAYWKELNSDNIYSPNFKLTAPPYEFPNCGWRLKSNPIIKFSSSNPIFIGITEYNYSCGEDIWDGEAGIIDIWDLTAGETVANLDNHGKVYSFAFSDDNKYFALSTSWGHMSKIPGGDSIYRSGNDSRLLKENFNKRKLLDLEGEEINSGISGFDFSPNSKLLLGFNDSIMFVWNTANGSLISRWDRKKYGKEIIEIYDVKFSYGGSHIITSLNIENPLSGIISSLIQIRDLYGNVIIDSVFYSAGVKDNKLFVAPDSISFIACGSDSIMRLFSNETLSEVFNKHEIKLQTSIYPNPAVYTINMSFYGLFGITKISLFNILGKELKSEQLYVDGTNNFVQFDISYLENGVYFITINNGIYSKAYNIIIQH